MSISLRPITSENWEDSIQLQVAPHQQSFIASNLYSLAESKFEQSFVPMGIYLDDRMIGFLMYGKDPEDGIYWIIRFMIDKAFQGKGYGRAALSQAVSFIAKLEDCSDTIILGVKEENTNANRFYQAFGFHDTGRREHGEILLEYLMHGDGSHAS